VKTGRSIPGKQITDYPTGMPVLMIDGCGCTIFRFVFLIALGQWFVCVQANGDVDQDASIFFWVFI
jgi:hypothetical protein